MHGLKPVQIEGEGYFWLRLYILRNLISLHVLYSLFLLLEQVGEKNKEKSIYSLLFMLFDYTAYLHAATCVTGCCCLAFGVAIGSGCLDIK